MDKKTAKNIFFKNNGNYYHMAHDGYMEEYQKYNIDKETEEKWIKELINLRLKEFKKTSDMIYLIPLVDEFNTYELLDELLSVKLKGTYINRFVIIELLSKLFNKKKKKILNCKEKKAIIKNIIKDITEEKIPPEYNYNIEERLEKIKKILGIK